MTNAGFAGFPSPVFDLRYSPPPPMATGRYYTGMGVGGSGAMTQNRCYYTPILIPTTGLIDRIAIEVQSAVGSAVVRLGLFADSSGMPGPRLVEAGSTINGNSATAQAVTVSVSWPKPGVVWVASAVQGAAANLQTLGGVSPWIGKGSLSVGGNTSAYYEDSVSGVLPPTPTVAGTDLGPRVSIRLAS